RRGRLQPVDGRVLEPGQGQRRPLHRRERVHADGQLPGGRVRGGEPGRLRGGRPVARRRRLQRRDGPVLEPGQGRPRPVQRRGRVGKGGAAVQSGRAGVWRGAIPVVCAGPVRWHGAGGCDVATGVCSNPARPDGTACTDGNACTQTDTCQAGACVGGNPVVCAASDQCHAVGTCDPSTGACSNPAKPDGAACNDGNACTPTDTCQAGACVGGNPAACP